MGIVEPLEHMGLPAECVPIIAWPRATDGPIPEYPLHRIAKDAQLDPVVQEGHRDGALLALDCHADYDVGAYADITPRVIQKGTYTATGPYRVANVALHSSAVYTNTTPGGAFRGFGVPQIAWAVESVMDVAADRLGRDPVDLRRQNLLAHGEEFAHGDTPVDGKLEESLNRVAAAIQWQQAPAAGHAKGVAATMKASVAPSVSEAIVRLHADGSASVLVSTVGTGHPAT